MFESLLDNGRWVWENFGMQGLLIFLTLVALYYVARCVRKGVEYRMTSLCEAIDACFARSGSHDVVDLVNAQYTYRNPYAHREYPVILALTAKALRLRHWGVGYFVKRRLLATIEERHVGLLKLVESAPIDKRSPNC